MVSVKFCGLTRPDDASEAVRLGASHVGVIFAGGPRVLTAARARDVLAPVPPSVERVGVFGADASGRVASVAGQVGLDVIQLHGDPRAADVAALRRQFDGSIWAVVRAEGSLLPDWAEELFGEADAVLLDAKVSGKLGGTGVALEWSALADTVSALRGGTPVVVAGGLKPENVADAIRLLSPDVVDVSSGVESAPGIKDHAKMRAFVDAALGKTVP